MYFLPDQVARQAGRAAILSDERKPGLRRAGPTGGEPCAGRVLVPAGGALGVWSDEFSTREQSKGS